MLCPTVEINFSFECQRCGRKLSASSRGDLFVALAAEDWSFDDDAHEIPCNFCKDQLELPFGGTV